VWKTGDYSSLLSRKRWEENFVKRNEKIDDHEMTMNLILEMMADWTLKTLVASAI